MVASLLRRSALVGALVTGAWAAPAAATTAGEALAASAVSTSSPWVPASGGFTANVEVPSFAFHDVPAGCELTVDGTLEFTGTLEGLATGTTTALVFAPCEQVSSTPPGTYADVFRFDGTFTGTVAGQDVTAPLSYAGVTYPGGAIDAAIVLGGDVALVARADAIVTVGGSYAGLAFP